MKQDIMRQNLELLFNQLVAAYVECLNYGEVPTVPSDSFEIISARPLPDDSQIYLCIDRSFHDEQ